MTTLCQQQTLHSNMMHLSNIILLLIFVLRVSGADGSSFFYNDKDFSVRVAVSRTPSNGSTKTMHVRELYSSSQARAKIEYKQDGLPVDFYYDARLKDNLLFSYKDNTCKQYNLQPVFFNLFSGSQVMAQFLMSLEGKFLPGTMRLVAHLSTLTSDMKQINWGNTSRPVTIRNIEVVGLKLKVASADDPSISVYLYYDKATFTDKETSCKSLVPMRVALEFGSSDEIIMMDYSECAIDTKPVAVPDSAEYQDELAVPVGYDCSKTLPKVEPFGTRDLDKTRLSFLAHTITMSGRDHLHFVALDGVGQTLRVDSREAARSALGMEAIRESRKLFDFRTNCRYVIVDEPEYKYGSIHELLDDELMARTDYRCALTEVFQPSKADQDVLDQMGLMQVLLGASKFAYMGRARVRGIEAEMYEAHSEMAPFWFSQPVIFKDTKGEWWVRTDEYNHGGTRIEYNVVLYMAAGHPVALEMFDTGFNKLPTLTTQFYDFVWDLVEAPDGSKPHTLFDHHDACLKGALGEQASANKYAEIELVLTGKDLRGADWLYSAPERQLSVVAGLRAALDERGFMVYDLETRIQRNEKQHDIEAIRVAFRVVQHPDSSFTLTFMGRARQLYGRGVLPLSTSAQTPVDCFWLLNQLEQKPRWFYVLYDGYSNCYTDPNPDLVAKKKLEDSRIFEMVDYGGGEVYRIDWNPDDKRGSESSRLFESQINRLASKQIKLLSPSATGHLDLQAKQVKVHNIDLVDHLSQSDNPGYDQNYAAVFPGFAFSGNQNNTWTYSFPKSVEDRTMTWAHCEAACLADSDCKSFSFCAGWPETSCTLCSLALDTPDVSSMLTSIEAASMTNITLDINDSHIELKRDYRCEIHNKLYVGMFERSHSAETTLANLRVYKVDNEEQCAEICFKKILDALETSDSLGDELDTMLDEGNTQLPEEMRKYRASRAQLSRNFCSQFMYLDGTLSEIQMRQVERRLKPTDATGDKPSYCLITDIEYERTLTDFGRGDLQEQSTKFELDVYYFDLANLYDKQPGISLASSELTDEESRALRAILKLPSEEEIRILKDADAAGKNFQYSTKVTDATHCASLCLFQASGLYPSCQSFDFRPGNYSICQLNTRSLSQLADNQLVDHSTTSFHYEPRFKSVRRRAELDAKQWNLWFARASTFVNSSFWSGFMSLLLLLTALTTGVFIGVKVTEKFLVRRSRARSASFATTNIVGLNEEDI